jgi:hypothetical protein
VSTLGREAALVGAAGLARLALRQAPRPAPTRAATARAAP